MHADGKRVCYMDGMALIALNFADLEKDTLWDFSRSGLKKPIFQLLRQVYLHVRKTSSLQGLDISTKLLFFYIFFDYFKRCSPTGCNKIAWGPQSTLPVALFQFWEFLP